MVCSGLPQVEVVWKRQLVDLDEVMENIMKGFIQYKIEPYTGGNNARFLKQATRWLHENAALREKMADAGFVYMDKHTLMEQTKREVHPHK